MAVSVGSFFLLIAALIFLALAIDLFAINAKGIDWNFFAHFFLCLGLIFGGWVITTLRRAAP
jgi:hypothetical protein